MYKLIYMDNSGTVKPSVSMSATLWNEIQKAISKEDITFSRFMQKGARLLLKTMKVNDVNEFLNALDDSELQLLKNEIKKRG